MDNFGFIHGELDTKILILFVLRRLSAPVDAATLESLCMFDSGVNYFDYSDCLADLIDTGHVKEASPGNYLITEKGNLNGEVVESSLPYSVRTKTEQMLAPIAGAMSRNNMIRAERAAEKGGVKLSLSMSDGKGEIISLSLLAADDDQAAKMEANFRRDAEGLYGRIAGMLLEDQEET